MLTWLKVGEWLFDCVQFHRFDEGWSRFCRIRNAMKRPVEFDERNRWMESRWGVIEQQLVESPKQKGISLLFQSEFPFQFFQNFGQIHRGDFAISINWQSQLELNGSCWPITLQINVAQPMQRYYSNFSWCHSIGSIGCNCSRFNQFYCYSTWKVVDYVKAGFRPVDFSQLFSCFSHQWNGNDEELLN